jgi:hypothetical protein
MIVMQNWWQHFDKILRQSCVAHDLALAVKYGLKALESGNSASGSIVAMIE